LAPLISGGAGVRTRVRLNKHNGIIHRLSIGLADSEQTVFTVFFDLTSALVSELPGGPGFSICGKIHGGATLFKTRQLPPGA